jgi:hypothetical protein
MWKTAGILGKGSILRRDEPQRCYRAREGREEKLEAT